jgi:DNA-binding LytR/AlgR family response regulator
MDVLIIEDELPAFKRLSKLLSEHDKHIHVLGQADSIESSVALFKQFPQAQLAFMDIELADGQSFEIFNRIQVTCPIVFTTAYDEFALKAFKVNSIDYLLKPIDPKELKSALDKYTLLQPKQDLSQFVELLKAPKAFKSRFLVKVGNKLISVRTEEIAYFQAYEKMVYLITNDSRKFIVDHSLDELNGMLNPQNFFQLNRQFLAHADAIESVSTYFNGKLKIQLKPDVKDEVLVSRDRASEFKNWMNG